MKYLGSNSQSATTVRLPGLRHSLLGLLLLLSCNSPGTHTDEQADDRDVVFAFYRLVIFLDSSLPRMPLGLVTGENAPETLSEYRYTAFQWWRCQDPSGPSVTSPEECLAATTSWGGHGSWWNPIPAPRIQIGSYLQLFLINSSRDPSLEGKQARVTIRFEKRGPREWNHQSPVDAPPDFSVQPRRTAYGGIRAPAWVIPLALEGFWRVQRPGTFRMLLTFDGGERVGRYFLATPIDVAP